MSSNSSEQPITQNPTVGQEEADLLKAVLDTVIDGILTIDSEGTILSTNPAAECIFGYTQQELVGRNVKILMPPPYHEEHDDYLRHYREGGERKIIGIGREVSGRRKDGTVFPLDLAVSETPTPRGQIFTGIVRDISERRRADEVHARLAALVESSDDAIISKTLEGTITTWNRGAERMFGFDAKEAVGQPMSILIPDDRIDEEPAILMRLQHGERIEQYETVRRRKDGSLLDVSLTVSPIVNANGKIVGASKIARDITGRRQAREALQSALEETERTVAKRTAELRASEARYSTLFHSTDEGFCIIEMIFDDHGNPLDYRFLEVNPAFERQTGIHDGAGKRMREIAPDHEEHWFEIYGKIAMDGEPVRFQNHAEQLGRHYDVYACRIGEPKDRLVAILFNDITEKLQMETDLREAKERAEKANLAKSEFLSRMSHELRTPLNSVLGYAQLLDLQYEDPRIRDSARSIIRGGRHLLEMINEVLDMTRIEGGQLAISSEPVDFAGVLNQAIGLVQPMADAASIEIMIVGTLCKELHLHADRQRLLQVMINLLGNAIKYNRPAGQVAVKCSELTSGFSRIEISDTGDGIEPGNQALLFQPFQRFGDLGIEGTGLGLALSERFVRLMGGRLGLAQSNSEGSTFFIELQRVNPAYMEVSDVTVERSAERSLAGYRGRVLYIEDNPSNMRLLEAVLSDWKDITLISAVQGLVGLDLAKQHAPDVILLDLHLPDIMGDKVLQRLKEFPSTKGIPVVVLSADATQRQISALLAGGAVDYLTKPLDLVRFVEVLREFLPKD